MKTNLSLRLALCGAVALLTHTMFAQSLADPKLDHVPGELLIKFVPQAPAAAILNSARSLGAAEIDLFANIGVRHWRLGQGVTTDQALKILAAPGLQQWIDYAEPNYLLYALDAANEPDFGKLWGLYNSGQTGGKPGADVHAVEAWLAGFTGSQDVVIGVVDTGIDYNHPDLAANIWTNPDEIPGNGIDDDGNGYIDDVHGWDFVNNDNDPIDDNGHGSHVAGTIGGVGNNGIGVAGVNWRVKLMPLKFLNASGSGSTTAAIQAINYAANKKVRITSNSWGGGQSSRALQDAIKNSDALFVAAAGNSGSSTKMYPAGYSLDNIIAVAATDHNDLLASFSNFGTWVHLAAPGVNVFSTYANDGYATLSGTSMATPHVSGAAALVMAYNPVLPILDVKNRLLQTVDVLPGLSGKVSTSGRLNVQKALGAPTPTVPMVYLMKTKVTGDSNNNGWAEPGETVQLTITLGNLRFAPATGVSATLSANSISIPSATQSFGDLAPDGSAAAVFGFAIDSGANSG
jgi:subtilisin family serine protease